MSFAAPSSVALHSQVKPKPLLLNRVLKLSSTMALPETQAMPAARTLLLFGPGVLALDEPYFNRILSAVKSDTANHWALHAIEDIASYWDALCEAIPKLQRTSGVSHAQKLAKWLRTGAIAPESTVANLPNAILGPLVIIAQLVEYLQHANSLPQSGLEDARGFQVSAREQTETIGCCIGVFSALVVSSSSSWPQFCHNAAAVLRTVFVLGALSDAQDASDAAGSSVSLMAFWRGGQSVSDLEKALDRYPEVSFAQLTWVTNSLWWTQYLTDDHGRPISPSYTTTTELL